MKFAFARSFALFTATLVLIANAFAQDKYPSKPIRIIVALGPGAGTDVLARFLATDPLRRELGADIIVENRAGAGGVVGGDFVAKSKPDGYTLALFHASVVSTATVVNPNVAYNPIRDFTPIASLVTNQLAILKAGKLRGLATTSAIKGFPNVPTFASRGFPQANLEVFFAMYGPANLPPEVMGKLEPAFERIMKNPGIQDKLEGMGFSILYEGSKQLGERVKHELGVVADVAKRAGIKGE